MKRACLIHLAMAVCVAMAWPVNAQPMVIVVRHGEKADDNKDARDPPLSAAGAARAVRLARMLSASGLTAIYTTQFQRTVQHAAPVARLIAVVPVVHPAADTPGLLRKINTHRTDDVVLVVGHGNTVPAILKGLGHSADVTIDESEYDNMFILTPKTPAAPALLRLRY